MKAILRPLGRLIGSAPFITAAGMCAVIGIGLAGSTLLNPPDALNPTHSNVFLDEHADIFQAAGLSKSLPLKVETPEIAEAALLDVQAVEAAPMETTDQDADTAMLSYSNIVDMLTFVPRPDPFAPVAPPGQVSLLTGKDALTPKPEPKVQLAKADADNAPTFLLFAVPTKTTPHAQPKPVEPMRVAIAQ